jgi:cytochrome c oxidase cbb3-type subunit 1/cytochrome c oxidase cbb3-type subunit I/II
MNLIRRLFNLALPAEEHSAARRFLLTSAVWFVGGTLVGMIAALALVAPDLTAGIAWLEFGRIKPVHISLVLFGFVTSGLVGGTLYVIPTMLKTRLQGERAANLALWFWNAFMVGATVTLALGYTQGRKYAEWIFPVKCLLVVALLLLLYVVITTIVARKENTLYVSVWYGAGAIAWTTLLFPLGNVMWHPATGAMSGIVDAVWLWWYGHNIFGLVITPLAVGMAYYIIPRVARQPVYSHTLSLIGFWSLIALYTHIGTHHLLQAPVPTWLKTVSIIDSFAMIVPVATALFNIWMSMRGAVARFADSYAGRYVFAGTLWYLVTCLQGPMQSLPSVQRYTHFTNWKIGHAHIAVLGFGGFIALGTLWYVLPLVARRKVYSELLLSLQYWLVLIGLTGFFLVLTVAGLIQGQGWVAGETVYRVLPSLIPYMASRAAFGVLIGTGAFVGLYNALMTVYRGEPRDA